VPPPAAPSGAADSAAADPGRRLRRPNASATLRPLAGYGGLSADGAYVPGEAVVKFASRPSLTALQIAAVGVDAIAFEPLDVSNAYLAELKQGQTVLATCTVGDARNGSPSARLFTSMERSSTRGHARASAKPTTL